MLKRLPTRISPLTWLVLTDEGKEIDIAMDVTFFKSNKLKVRKKVHSGFLQSASKARSPTDPRHLRAY